MKFSMFLSIAAAVFFTEIEAASLRAYGEGQAIVDVEAGLNAFANLSVEAQVELQAEADAFAQAETDAYLAASLEASTMGM